MAMIKITAWILGGLFATIVAPVLVWAYIVTKYTIPHPDDPDLDTYDVSPQGRVRRTHYN